MIIKSVSGTMPCSMRASEPPLWLRRFSITGYKQDSGSFCWIARAANTDELIDALFIRDRFAQVFIKLFARAADAQNGPLDRYSLTPAHRRQMGQRPTCEIKPHRYATSRMISN